MMRTTWVTLEAGLMMISLVVAVGCGRSPAPQTSTGTGTDRTPAAPMRVRGTMPSVEESLAIHGYCFYERRDGSFFHQNLPIPPAQHRISIKPVEPSHLWMEFDLEADGTTIRSIRFGGNPLEEYFLFEVDNVARQLDDELKEEVDTSNKLQNAIRYAANPVYANFNNSRVGRWIVTREPGGIATLQIVVIRRASGAE